ncbi:MAG: DEAD/DEAH box helicase [Actinomycetota bacterium]|nr:DEAD/DEAH box helicase [Actinomycetota bacterium]
MSALDEVSEVLATGTGHTAAEVRDALRAQGRVSITAADVERVLVSHRGWFQRDSGEPPRWWPAGAPRSRRDTPSTFAVMPGLYAWQTEALEAWRRQGRRGVVEAVTGTGKTMVGVAAVAEELAAGGQACVLVPTRELLGQWRGVLGRCLPPGRSVGLLGGGHHQRLGDHDALVAVVNSARVADLAPRRPGGLLVADECHRYGSEENRCALATGLPRRLGLSATYARSDDAHLSTLDPYFGGTCYRLDYRRALDDGVIARSNVTLVGVRLGPDEQAAYDELTQTMSAARGQLVGGGYVPAEPFGAFIEAVSALARTGGDAPAAFAARRYLRAMQDRRHLLAESPAKVAALTGLVPVLRTADRAIVFTQTIVAAERAAAQLQGQGLRAAAVHSDLDPGTRRSVLERFAAGALDVVSAPQVLDEGVDVPAADLAVILSASRSRRQMVQRMGRVLRRKADGRRARFVVVSVEDTIEDPALGAHHAFLDEITSVADVVRSFPSGSPHDEVCAAASER